MGITITSPDGEQFSNEKLKRKKFRTQGAWLKFIIGFIQEQAKIKGTQKKPSNLKDARFLYYKPNGKGFDKIEFDINITEKELNQLTKILWDSSGDSTDLPKQ